MHGLYPVSKALHVNSGWLCADYGCWWWIACRHEHSAQRHRTRRWRSWRGYDGTRRESGWRWRCRQRRWTLPSLFDEKSMLVCYSFIITAFWLDAAQDYQHFWLQGLGKRVPVSLFRVKKNRRGKGLTAIRLSAGDALAAADVVGAARDGKDCTQEDALISTVNGMLLRVPISQVAKTSRYAKGHRVVKVKEGDEVSAVTAIQHQ